MWTVVITVHGLSYPKTYLCNADRWSSDHEMLLPASSVSGGTALVSHGHKQNERGHDEPVLRVSADVTRKDARRRRQGPSEARQHTGGQTQCISHRFLHLTRGCVPS